jgi:hypothetical protein
MGKRVNSVPVMAPAFTSWNRSTKLFSPALAMMGAERRKEKRAEVYRWRPRARSAAKKTICARRVPRCRATPKVRLCSTGSVCGTEFFLLVDGRGAISI